ncbi:MAG: FHA domain-containing protein [Desulfobacterales bacterium]
MPTLTLKFNGNVVREYDVIRGQAITIGRLEDNHVVIENLAVSGHHARIDTVGDGFLLTDLKSKNGSFVNERMISTHWLQDGDRVSIGKHTLVFACAPGEKISEGAPSDADKTMIIDTGRYRDMLSRDDGTIARERKSENDPVGVLSYLSGGDGEFELVKKLIKIGKEPGSDIRVSGLTIGSTAATVSRRPNGYYLSYVGGFSKPRVNGEAVKESIPLNEFDIIEIGGTKLQFFTRE